MTTIATICARGGSIGLPNKNILEFYGKPLIAHTIQQALMCDFIDNVIVSTDNEEIAKIALQFGAEVPFLRPSYLATPEAGKIPAIQHCVDFLIDKGERVNKIIDLQPTSPLRSIADIKACYDLLTERVEVVFSVTEPKHNPYFSMIELDPNDEVYLSKGLEASLVTRQEAPKVYGLNGAVYVWHTRTLAKGLWGGKSKIYVMPPERSIDIDTQYDFSWAEFLYKEGLK